MSVSFINSLYILVRLLSIITLIHSDVAAAKTKDLSKNLLFDEIDVRRDTFRHEKQENRHI